MDDLMANHNANVSFRLFMGCASWAPGQLEEELKMKFWTVGDANANIVFYQKPEILWWYILRFVSSYDPGIANGPFASDVKLGLRRLFIRRARLQPCDCLHTQQGNPKRVALQRH